MGWIDNMRGLNGRLESRSPMPLKTGDRFRMRGCPQVVFEVETIVPTNTECTTFDTKLTFLAIDSFQYNTDEIEIVRR